MIQTDRQLRLVEKLRDQNKICLITGATSGIGKAAAAGMAQMGFTTVVVGRSRSKCERVCKKIAARTGNTKVYFLVADLSSQCEIQRLADEFKRTFNQLDVLVNNAGAKILSRLMTVDGVEMTFALNHLAYFLLTQLLIDHLNVAGNARIINVSSGAHGSAAIDFNDLQNEKAYIGKNAYNQSKLANLLFTYELARRLNGTGITVNAMAPGGVITNFCRNNGWMSWTKHVAAHILAGNLIGPRKAAETILYLAASPAVVETGKYFYEKNPIASSQASYNEDDAKCLWKISEALTELQ